ncbi:hypothetical protein ACROYT_G000316 [Oculina patagonica]
MILTELWKSKEDSAVCASTEEMIAEMKKVNSVQVDNDLVVGSADVKAVYPSLDIDFTIEKVCDIFFKSDVQVEGVDYEEVGLYLAINSEPEVLQRSNIADVRDVIHPSIKLEVDYPSKHPDKKLPILDLKVWVEHREKKVQESNQMVSVMMYEFYKKEIASKALVNARSAMSASAKRTVLSQAVLRVLLNCSPLLPWANVVEKVEEMVLRMQCSGYNKNFRYEVVDSAIKAYRAIQRETNTSTERMEERRERNREI